MPTPDEVYEQVLAEETAKGSSPAVAQARAKAARVRAQRGAADPTKAVAAAPAGGDGAAKAAEPAAAAEAPKPAATATAPKPAARATAAPTSDTPARRA